MLQPCINRQSSHPSRSTSCRPGCRHSQREVEFRRARASTWPCCFVDGASPQRQARNTEPVPPHQYDKTRVSAKRRAPCLRREAIAASNVPRHRPNTLPFSRLSASCEDTNDAPTAPWHADVDRKAAQWWRGSLMVRFVRRRAVVRDLVWPRTAKSSRPGPLLHEESRRF